MDFISLYFILVFAGACTFSWTALGLVFGYSFGLALARTLIEKYNQRKFKKDNGDGK